MLFWIGVFVTIAGLVFGFNGVEWFDGEDNLVVPLIAVGVGIIALYVVLSVIAVRRVKKSMARARARHGSFFDF